MSVQQDFQEARGTILHSLVGVSGFDPQTNDMDIEFKTGLMGPVDNLIRDLSGEKLNSAAKLRRLKEVSSVIADHFNKQGFAQPNGPTTKEKVESTLRENLPGSVKIPAALGLVS